jgi:uncharacterized protein (TIGR03083 family)
MVATRQEIADTVRGFIQRADQIAAGLSPADWEKTTYEQGWTVKQVYCHLASLGASIPFFVNMVTNPQLAAGIGAGFDVDAWNAQQVAQRQGRSTEEVLAELRTGFEGSLKFLDGVSDEVLAIETTSAFSGQHGTLADILVGSFTGHHGVHLDDIERAIRS